MSRATVAWPPKDQYPPVCPALREPCRRRACWATRKYSWRRVFLSVPYDPWYRRFSAAIRRALAAEEVRYVAVEAREAKRTRPLSLGIYEHMCSCAHAIVDLSAKPGTEGEGSAGGVLIENSFLRSTAEQVLHVVRRGTPLCAEAQSLEYEDYDSPEELMDIVRDWVQRLDTDETAPVRRLLFNQGPIQSYRIWYHCKGPTASGLRPDDIGAEWDDALPGGGSGAVLLDRAFRALQPSKQHRMLARRCTEDEPRSAKHVADLPKRNLYLLDSPFTRDGNGTRPLNWVMGETFGRLERRRSRRPSVAMEIIPPGSPGEQEHPGEKLRLRIGNRGCAYATPAWDYGFVVRTRTPFDRQAFVLLLAGIHAPASHAAAEAVAVPARAGRLIAKLEGKGLPSSGAPCFEAVFRVRRTYLREDLGELQWLHTQPLP